MSVTQVHIYSAAKPTDENGGDPKSITYRPNKLVKVENHQQTTDPGFDLDVIHSNAANCVLTYSVSHGFQVQLKSHHVTTGVCIVCES